MGSNTGPFRYERELAMPVTKWLLDQNLSVRAEFRTPWGVCDIVAAELDQQNVERRLEGKQQQCIGPLSRVTLLLSIPDLGSAEEASIHSLETVYGGTLSGDLLLAELNMLSMNRFIQKTATGGYQRLNGWMPLHKRIIAVELKLNRVSASLHQAINNREIAPESYVAFPQQVAERLVKSPRVHDFERVGVGIIGANHIECEVLLSSRTRSGKAQSAAETHCVEQFWKTQLKAIQH